MPTAWCLLAVVLASFDHNWSHALVNIGGGVAYVAFTLAGGATAARSRQSRGSSEMARLPKPVWSSRLALMALGAWFTDLIGLHAVFGAFVMGAAMPRGVIVRDSHRPHSAAYGGPACCRFFSLTPA